MNRQPLRAWPTRNFGQRSDCTPDPNACPESCPELRASTVRKRTQAHSRKPRTPTKGVSVRTHKPVTKGLLPTLPAPPLRTCPPTGALRRLPGLRVIAAKTPISAWNPEFGTPQPATTANRVSGTYTSPELLVLTSLTQDPPVSSSAGCASAASSTNTPERHEEWI